MGFFSRIQIKYLSESIRCAAHSEFKGLTRFGVSIISRVPLPDLNEYGMLVACEQTAEYAAYLDLFQRIRSTGEKAFCACAYD